MFFTVQHPPVVVIVEDFEGFIPRILQDLVLSLRYVCMASQCTCTCTCSCGAGGRKMWVGLQHVTAECAMRDHGIWFLANYSQRNLLCKLGLPLCNHIWQIYTRTEHVLFHF